LFPGPTTAPWIRPISGHGNGGAAAARHANPLSAAAAPTPPTTRGQPASVAGALHRQPLGPFRSFGSGEELGPRFVIESLLGEGGMGRVYKVYDRELDRYAALKVLLPDLAGDPQIIQRFKHELLLASRISHKNILRITT